PVAAEAEACLLESLAHLLQARVHVRRSVGGVHHLDVHLHRRSSENDCQAERDRPREGDHSSPAVFLCCGGTGAWTPGMSGGSGVARWWPEASGFSTSQMTASPLSVLSTTGRSPGSLSAVTDDTSTPATEGAGETGRRTKNAAAATATSPPTGSHGRRQA